jgi:CRP/FNR family cyclic AMP-dependent transcriptional regulator
MPVDPALIASMPFFRSFGDDERSALADVVDVVHIPAGKTVFNVGDPGDAMYIVRSGAAETFITDNTGNRIVLSTVQPGDFFGEIALLHPGPRTATVTVTKDLEALRMDRNDLEHALRLQPTIALDLLAVVGARLRDTNMRLRHTASRNVNDEFPDNRTVIQKAADWIAEFSGSIPFFLINAGFFFVWIVINTGLVPGVKAFDPFPFGLLTMSVSLEAIFLSIFVLIAQNRQAAKDRVRSDIEYDVNLKAELEIAYLHEKLDAMNADVLARLDRVQRRLGAESATTRGD